MRHWSKIVRVMLTAVLLLPAGADSLFAMACLSSQVLETISPEGVDQPSDIAIGPQGYIYLVDGVNNRIVVMDQKGDARFTFGAPGDGPGELRHPLGIGISKTGRVFIADTGNHRIQEFDARGRFVGQFPVKTAIGEKPAAPVDVLMLESRNCLYISDRDNHKIKVQRPNGEFVFEWGGFGEVQGRFRYPAMLAVNEFHQVFVVDVLNTRVQEFDPDGRFINEIGQWGVAPGQLFRPKGVAVDTSGRIFISDSFMECIQVFSDLGGFISVVCDGASKRTLTTPVGITFDALNRLYAVEMRANRICVLKIAQ